MSYILSFMGRLWFMLTRKNRHFKRPSEKRDEPDTGDKHRADTNQGPETQRFWTVWQRTGLLLWGYPHELSLSNKNPYIMYIIYGSLSPITNKYEMFSFLEGAFGRAKQAKWRLRVGRGKIGINFYSPKYARYDRSWQEKNIWISNPMVSKFWSNYQVIQL